jgi:oligopeptide/dipeptide ABC transporter ATP-binding protein
MDAATRALFLERMMDRLRSLRAPGARTAVACSNARLGLGAGQVGRRAEGLVRLPRPAERLNAYPYQLSGGLRQRVMIAMALVNSPRLLVADEPTTALDVTIQAQILDLIDNLRRDFEMAVILITHDLGVIAARANRVMVMYAGKIAEGAGTEELFGSMRHPYTEALFRSIPRFDQDRTRALFSIPGVPPDLMYPPPGCRFAPQRAGALHAGGATARTGDPRGERPGAGSSTAQASVGSPKSASPGRATPPFRCGACRTPRARQLSACRGC